MFDIRRVLEEVRLRLESLFNRRHQLLHGPIRLVEESKKPVKRIDGICRRSDHEIVPLHASFLQPLHFRMNKADEIPILRSNIWTESGKAENVLRCFGRGVCFHYDFSHYAIRPTAASADREEEVGILARVGDKCFARRYDDSGLEEVVSAHAVGRREHAVAASGYPAHESNIRVRSSDDDGVVISHCGLDFASGFARGDAGCSYRAVNGTVSGFESGDVFNAAEVVRPDAETAEACAPARD